MRQTMRTARHDPVLGLDAYCLRGLERPFPSHFHGHYVIGVVERGTRTLTCGRRRDAIGPGDVLLLNPRDSHGCVREDGALDYRGLNISRDTMMSLAEETPGPPDPAGLYTAGGPGPGAGPPPEGSAPGGAGRRLTSPAGGGAGAGLWPPAAGLRRTGRDGRLPGRGGTGLRLHAGPLCTAPHPGGHQPPGGIEQVRPGPGLCPGKGHHALPLSAGAAGGPGPASAGAGPVPGETALAAGFSDQSHFTNYFTAYTGLTPGAYRALFREERERG